MAFNLSEDLNEIRIFDERSGSTQSLFARDPSPREQLAYSREAVQQKRGAVVNHLRRTRLKYGCLILERPQAAQTPKEEGYGFRLAGQWVPLTGEADQVPIDSQKLQAEYAQVYGADWAGWIKDLPPWKQFLLAKAPLHIERVASVIFEGASDYKQALANAEGEGEDEEGADDPN